MRRICLQWPRFGPYHIARLEATARHFHPLKTEVIGLETCGLDATYEWREERGEVTFRREQLFPGRTFETLDPPAIHRGVMQALDRIDPDAVLVNSYSFPDARASLEWCLHRKRIAVVATDSKEDDARRIRWREWVKTILINQFDAALLAGTPQKHYFEKLGFPSERIFLGYDVVDNAYFETAAASARMHPEAFRHLPGLDDSRPFFLSVNRFLPIKNLDRLLSAYRDYRERSPEPWNLVLVGDGSERDKLGELIRRERIEGVILAGFRHIDELPAYYGRAGALVHPTLKDTWGLVINEAMAAGLPVLVSEKAGCATDLVKDGENGFIFDPVEPSRLAELMVQIAESEGTRKAMGVRSREIIADWSLQRFTQSLEKAVSLEKRHPSRASAALGRILLLTTRTLARTVHSFHSVPD